MSVLLSVDPRVLVFAANVRTDMKLDRGFVASVRERGVLQPVVAYPGADGPVVQFGHRRTQAALECGLSVVPVLLVEEPEGVDRVTDQLVENDARAGLSVAERVAGWEQLAAFGLSAAAIAKRTGTKKADVASGLRVAGSELASKAGARWDFLTLDQVAAVAEFEADPEAVKAIVAAARSGRFDHTLQLLRDERAEAQAFARVRAQVVADGVAVVEREEMVWPMSLLDNHGIDPAGHASCPGHAAYVGYGANGGKREVCARFVCRDVLAHGHVDAASVPDRSGRRSLSEEEKAARRLVVERNRLWRSATTVRRQWLQGFAARKAAPAGVERFVLSCLVAGDHPVRQAMESGWPLLRELLGFEVDPTGPVRAMASRAELAQAAEAASPKRCLVLVAAALFAAWEDRTGPHTWRHQSAETARYLGQMAEWGYEPSDIETYALTGEDPSVEEPTTAAVSTDPTAAG